MPDLPMVNLSYTSQIENKYLGIVKYIYIYILFYPLLGAVNWLI